MAGVAVSVATGALKPLVEKLAAALGDQYKRFKGVRGEIKSLTAELDAMHAFLVKMSEEENPDVQDKVWTKEVRELSYDMEDSLDEFVLRVDEKSVNPDGFINKCKDKLTKLKTRYKIVKVIEDLKIQVEEVAKRNARYKIQDTTVNTTNMSVDPRALTIFDDASKLIGIDRPKYDLIKFLKINYECESSRKLKVVSIVGTGGLGKTTLANQVYQALKGQFHCGAFVSVSRTPDIMKILRIILSEVSSQPYANTEAGSIEQLIGHIRKYLEGQRFLIVIDDIWKEETWTPINHALLENSKHSRIITTTRMHKLAEACCSSDGDLVYRMKPLGHTDSEILFHGRIFGSKYNCPAHLIDVSDKIIQKCDGLPLAIISISGILANKPQTVDHWTQVLNSVGRALGKNPDAHSMMQILSLSYFDLPHHLKTCLLYLSVFPEDSLMDKRRLVRRWIAEGFIQEEQGHNKYELGEMCFNELINRSLILAREVNMYGEVTSCQVHDTILDFLLLKSEEENFITVFDDDYKKPSAQSRVRRLSLQAKSQEIAPMMEDMKLSHVRSVTVFDNSVELRSWSKFHILRVLDLQGCRKVEDHHIADIVNLFQLKYLGLRETGVYELPELVRKLQYLETLDVKKTRVTKLPASITQLPRLVYLAIDEGVQLPDGIGTMTSLEDLDCVDICNQSIEFTRELGQLENLRNVWFFFTTDNCSIAAEGSHYKEYMTNIVSSLFKLGHLHSVSIDIDPKRTEECSLDSASWTPSGLQRFEITGHFISKVPNWAGSLVHLQVLSLYVMEFAVQDIKALGRLPALEFLRLVAPVTFLGRRITISGADGFQCLRHFDYGCAIPVTFKDGAMPKLKNLTLLLSAPATSFLVGNEYFRFRFGMQHLSSLDSVHCRLCVNSQAAVSWIDDMRTQMTSRTCELAKLWIAMMEATITTEKWEGDDMDRALRNPLISHKLKLTQTISWTMQGKGEDPLVSEIHRGVDNSPRKTSLTMQGYDKVRLVGLMCTLLVHGSSTMLQRLDRQVMERVRNCPLKGLGNCQCQGLPEAS